MADPRAEAALPGVAPGGDSHEPPPVGTRWGRLYALVITGLWVEIALCAWLTWAYR